jgi:type VI secretion system protein ImpM
MQTSTTALIGYGKLPVHGDFVRHNAGGSAVRALDEWLQRGLYVAKTQLGSAFDAAYDSAPAYRFLFAPREAEPALIGVMRPSRDRNRRTFPFLIAYEAESGRLDSQQIVRMPPRNEAFLEQADALTADVADGHVGHREIGDWLDRSGLMAAAGNGSPLAYDRFLAETTVGSLCAECWGYFDDSRKYLLFRNLIELLTPLKGDVPPGFTLGLRFPLGAAVTSERTAAFWLDLCFRLLGFPDVTPICFWSNAAADADRGSLALFFRLPPAHALIHLLSSDAPENDYLCDLETMGGGSAADAALAIPQRLGSLLESEELNLQQFLDQL